MSDETATAGDNGIPWRLDTGGTVNHVIWFDVQPIVIPCGKCGGATLNTKPRVCANWAECDWEEPVTPA